MSRMNLQQRKKARAREQSRRDKLREAGVRALCVELGPEAWAALEKTKQADLTTRQVVEYALSRLPGLA